MNQPKLVFDVIYETSLNQLEASMSPNHHLVSICNDYEDGKWRDRKFISFLMDNLFLTALSYEERKKCLDSPYSALSRSIKNMRVSDKQDRGQGGELAEICLYGIMHAYYNALPVVPKIFYKQNSNDNAKGADSVHIRIEENNTFTLWLGEAKFYNSLSTNRFADPVKSVLSSLNTIKLQKENSIITNIKDLDQCLSEYPSVLVEIKEVLSEKTTIDRVKKHLHIPILYLHECEDTQCATDLDDDFKDILIQKHKKAAIFFFDKLRKQNNKEATVYKFDIIHFHLILFPIANKETIVNGFYSMIDALK